MLNLDKIRPSKALEEYFLLVEKKGKSIVNTRTNKVYSHLLEEISCLICGSRNYETLYNVSGFTIVRCCECSLVYLNPRLKRDNHYEFHNNSEAFRFFFKNIIIPTAEYRNEKIFLPRVDLINRVYNNGNKGKRLLDIGCALGHFLQNAEKSGWIADGVEADDFASEYAREAFGLKVMNGLFEHVEIAPESYDAVCLWETIEHMLYPMDIMKKINRIIKNNGRIFLSAPNIDGFEYQALQEHARWSPPYHVAFYTPFTITRLLERAGFYDIRIVSNGTLDLEIVLDYIDHMSFKKGHIEEWFFSIRKERLFYDFKDIFTRFLHENAISGNMIVYAIKGQDKSLEI